MPPQRDTSPSAYQEVFVTELRARRDMAGLSRNRLAAALGCTPQWLAKVETFEKPPSEGLADDLDTYFQTGGLFRRLWEKHQEARKLGLIPSGFQPLIAAEKRADEISVYEPVLIPGLFQTDEYARLLFSVGLRPDKVDELVAIRMERQKVLAGSECPVVFSLIREAVLRDLPSEVRSGQCKHLLDLMSQPTICIQVLPVDALVFHPAGYQVLGFDKGAAVAYMEGTGGNGQMLTDPVVIRKLSTLFNMARAEALPGGESASLIRRIMQEDN
ncbi:helix-turn-helix transcriptional regulator [Actinomadura sp. NEAU-AAG7]|uniref:helix-turn-helix domain-containing protein n=1 Tax=Actinomadura sp. NEAU-AAG7 TaxID=2839640 RepID=UPI001BE4998E|nr:helix-turn-helix transcriptional regulator [Actinomadura sp. NEAU-AAG7]MBT2208571.1 helix-turn-helix transcriptional regulator [Actinomadura sp. NEAU-AAG7]